MTDTITYQIWTTSSAGVIHTVHVSGLRELEHFEQETLPALADQEHPPTPSMRDIEVATRQNQTARQLIRATRHAPSCEGCVCFRMLVDIPDPDDCEDSGIFGYGPRVRTRRMCAHPAYSRAVVDFTRGSLDFTPTFTCEESRSLETICGPEGRLYVGVRDTLADLLREAGREWETFRVSFWETLKPIAWFVTWLGLIFLAAALLGWLIS